MQWNTKTEEWEKAVRNVRLQAVLLRSSMRFDKRKGIKEKKQEEDQVSLSYLWNDPQRAFLRFSLGVSKVTRTYTHSVAILNP